MNRFCTVLAPVAAIVCAMPGRVHAAPANQVDVLEVATDDADDQAKALTAALKQRLRTSKDLQLGSADFSLSVIVLALKCPGDVPDINCQNKIADKLSVDRYIWGTMRKAPGNQVIADLRLYQRGKPEVRQQFTYSDNLTEPADPALQRLADEMITRLTSFGKIGVARVTAEQSLAGSLFVDGQEQGPFTNGTSELTLPVGDHKFEVRSGTKVLASGSGKVTPTGTLEVQLQPAPKGGVEVSTASTGGGGNWKKTAGYVGVGVGGAMILGGIYSLIQVNSINHDSGFDAYRKGFGPNDDVCKQAAAGTVVAGAPSPADIKSKCDSGSTYQTLQYVLFPVGAIAAGVGVYFLASSSKQETGKVEVTPSVGIGSGRVDLRVRF